MARAKSSRTKRTAKKATKTAAKQPAKSARAASGKFPSKIFGIASPCSIGGVSLFEADAQITSQTVGNFVSEPALVERAVQLLSDAGFEVLRANNVMINIAGSRTLYETVFNTKLVAEELPTVKEQGKKDTATFFDSPDTSVRGLISTKGTRFEGVLEGVALEEPRYLMQNAFPPAVNYWHLDVPGDVSLGCNADLAHRDGVTGRGIRVAMVDTGWFRHPFFTQRGYRVGAVTLGAGTANPNQDTVGHGTGESANIFAVAPDVELLPVKAMLAGSLGTVLVNITAAFNDAVALNPHIITNSWGFDIQNGPLSAAQQALAASVAAAVSNGIVVVFSAGNGHFGFPGQHPDVISAGGVFLNADGTMRASNYASGFISNVYSNRRVPDLSGLVGMLPQAIYIMLPVEANDDLDRDLAGGAHPNRDQTASNDAWAAFSGTSAAAPQIAGAAALVLQACPHLTPAQVKSILMRSARDVTTGTNNPRMNIAATVGPDAATGNGLVDAHAAVLLAKVRCLVRPLTPIRPLVPLRPLLPVIPLLPVRPILPLLPLVPVQPLRPISPVLPLLPVRPLLPPIQPLLPVRPLLPIRPLAPIGPGPGPNPAPGPRSGEEVEQVRAPEGMQLTEENIRQLEDMIMSGQRDILKDH